MILIQLLCSSIVGAESSMTEDILIEHWCEKYVNNQYEYVIETADTSNYEIDVMEQNTTSQTNALITAIDAILLLNYETPTSLYEEYYVMFRFHHVEDRNKYVWDVIFVSDDRVAYTISVFADSGTIYELYVFNESTLPEQFFDADSYVDAIIDKWYEAYSDSANFAYDVYAMELENAPFPDAGEMCQRDVLRCIVNVLHILGETDNARIAEYIPRVRYNVSSNIKWWEIILSHPEKHVSFTIDADTGVMESMTWDIK